jgi:hypothetical protein
MVKAVTPEVNPDTEPLFLVDINGNVQVKGEVIPRTNHEGPEGEYTYVLFNFGVRWCGWSTACPGHFTTGTTRYTLYRRLCVSQGRSGRVRKISPPLGFVPQTIQPVASRYTNWAIPAQFMSVHSALPLPSTHTRYISFTAHKYFPPYYMFRPPTP